VGPCGTRKIGTVFLTGFSEGKFHTVIGNAKGQKVSRMEGPPKEDKP